MAIRYTAAMLTALISVPAGGSHLLGPTLEALVPGVVRGLVGDAVVSALADDDDARRIADAVGATFVARSTAAQAWREAAAAGRGRAVLLLAAGDVLVEPWMSIVERHLDMGTILPVRLRRVVPGLWQGLSTRVRRLLPGGMLAPGLLALRSDVAAASFNARTGRLSARIEARKA